MKSLALDILYNAGEELSTSQTIWDLFSGGSPNGRTGPATALLGNMAEALTLNTRVSIC